MFMISDAEARRRALEPGSSFIVQAPAGSGKTTLLVQRLLALLATAEQPEEVVAITFTRKAAAEMRQRVIAALQQAALGSGPAAEGHETKTFQLATAVLERDRAMGWNLLQSSGRLRVDTIDALNLWLAERLPLLSGAIAGLELVDDARGLFRQAARLCLSQLPDSSATGTSLRRLLDTFDNKAGQLERLLITLLPRRDRWLHHLAPGQDDAQLRTHLEAGLRALVEQDLAAARQVLQQHGAEDWLVFLNHASKYATKDALTQWTEQAELPEPRGDQLPLWRCLTELFLTQKGEWRKKIDKSIGFPTAAPGIKADFKGLLEELASNDAVLEALNDIRGLPEPRYDDTEWQALLDFRQVAIATATELQLVFRQRGQCDFVELAGLAQRALGDLEQPSDLLLALDHRIRHLLVDEFQDTSHGQFELLKKLTAGWDGNDGRTLFLVGDPMQSIYRFRDADMSLFLKVRDAGLGNLLPQSLVLRRNFRSQAGLIDWVNKAMAPLMPPQDDLGRGAAAFVPSEAARSGSQGPQLRWLETANPAAEVNEVVGILGTELTRDPDQSIAVLVQNRSHLAGLRDRLEKQGIAAHAVDIEPLHRRQIIQDLIGLARALTHRLDRIAWLGLFRAPWCGITLAGLETLCLGLSADDALYDAIRDPQRQADLAEADRKRLLLTIEVLAARFGQAGGQSTAAWLEDTWFSLGGPGCCLSHQELDDAQRFFRELAILERAEGLDDPLSLASHFEELTNLDFPTGTGVEIMTIHKAKGLEFDTVLLMGLGRRLRGDDRQALRWLELDRLDDERPLLAPLPVADSNSRLYNFIQVEDRARDNFELYRRLYVALTRARERLYLIGHVSEDGEPEQRSALARLWRGLGDQLTVTPARQACEPDHLTDEPPQLRRYRGDIGGPGLYKPLQVSAEEPLEFEWVGQAAVLVGTAVHEWLMIIARQGVDQWPPDRVEQFQPQIKRQLALGGLSAESLSTAAAQVTRALRAALEDPRGRWLLQPHSEAESELRLAVWTGTRLERLIVDRTFVENGTRWIIDYKTSTHEGADLAGFVQSEVSRYQPQLERYANALQAADPRPIKVALYFPLLGMFESWQPGDVSGNSD
jgi:ATP-dependent helicase/nuclease subunit A